MAVDPTTAVYNCSLIVRPREPDFHILLSLLKTVAAFAFISKKSVHPVVVLTQQVELLYSALKMLM